MQIGVVELVRRGVAEKVPSPVRFGFGFGFGFGGHIEPEKK
jgi:hypothetical protein